MLEDSDVRDNRELTFCLEEELLWTHFLARSNSLKLKCLDGFVSYKHAAFHFSIY